MTKYCLQKFGTLHPGRKLQWLKIFVMARDVPHDEDFPHNETTPSNETVGGDGREDIWLLALYIGEKDNDKIGRSFSLRRRFNVKKGAIYLVYKVN